MTIDERIVQLEKIVDGLVLSIGELQDRVFGAVEGLTEEDDNAWDMLDSNELLGSNDERFD